MATMRFLYENVDRVLSEYKVSCANGLIAMSDSIITAVRLVLVQQQDRLVVLLIWAFVLGLFAVDLAVLGVYAWKSISVRKNDQMIVAKVQTRTFPRF
ncbi:hypothetical protein V1512DRAFT_245329 [Lipomyces arxii]|uniref:uncharacterized protein n=1 Tax=Lipomyces arxii TaxID=56418 RepID=UPI0034CE4578